MPTPQHMLALDRANGIRLARAELKRQLARGDVKVWDVISDPPEEAYKAQVQEMLGAVHRVGKGRVRKMCGRAGVNPVAELGQLTVRQKMSLVHVTKECLHG